MESANRRVSWQKAAGDASWPGEKEPLESGNKAAEKPSLGFPPPETSGPAPETGMRGASPERLAAGSRDVGSGY